MRGGILASEQRCVGRDGPLSGHHGSLEQSATLCKLIDVRGRITWVSITRQTIGPKRIKHNEHYIWFSWCLQHFTLPEISNNCQCEPSEAQVEYTPNRTETQT